MWNHMAAACGTHGLIATCRWRGGCCSELPLAAFNTAWCKLAPLTPLTLTLGLCLQHVTTYCAFNLTFAPSQSIAVNISIAFKKEREFLGFVANT